MMLHGVDVFHWIDGVNGERLVLLKWENQPPTFCNLRKIGADGRTIWTVQPLHPLEGIYTDIKFQAGQLKCYNCAGYAETIDYKSGKVLSRVLTK